MIPKYYMDFKIKSGFDGIDVPVNDVVSVVTRVAHSAAAKNKFEHAIAFPLLEAHYDWSLVRLFTESLDAQI